MSSLTRPDSPSNEIREQFPALDQTIKGRPLAYLDNAATTQKPWSVLRAMQMFYQQDNANVHRGVHALSQRATDAFDAARAKVSAFINAAEPAEIIFTKGCTEAINLVAASWGRTNLKPGDEILLSSMEHHANIVPWQLVAEQTGAIVRPIPISDSGELDLLALETMISARTRLIGIVHVSNSLGTINPIAEVVQLAKKVGALTMIDGAQATAHLSVDVRALGVDFYSLSAHKMYGPTGVGALYARRELLETMPPYQGGGDMIRTVSFEKTTYNVIPNKFEPGTPNIAGVIGWGAAIDFLNEFGVDQLQKIEDSLSDYARLQLRQIEGLQIIGTADSKVGVFSFTMEGVHPHDIGTILDQVGVAVRTGHHCCMPLMKRLGISATARASLAVYNSKADIDQLIQGIRRVQEVFA